MYIHPFLAGVLATILTEFAVVVITSFVLVYRGKKR